jgi:hypothetical protein
MVPSVIDMFVYFLSGGRQAGYVANHFSHLRISDSRGESNVRSRKVNKKRDFYQRQKNKKIKIKVNKQVLNYKKIKMNNCDNCSICLSKMQRGNEVFQTKCGHNYHQKCLKKHLTHTKNNKTESTCPMCRKPI